MIQVVYNGDKDPRKLATDVLGPTVRRMSQENSDIVFLDSDLMACSGTTAWFHEEPEKAINCGIAEANMVGIACGMAAVGYKPFCHSFGTFASRRCYDQVFLSGAYARNDIVVIGTDPGVYAAFNGGTHMPFEDVALYRAIPGATVLDITDAAMLENLLPKLPERKGVKYLRMNRKENVRVYADGSDFEIGKGVVLRDGADVAVFASGLMVAEALNAAEILEKEGVSVAVIDIFTLKPLDIELVRAYAKKTGRIVTAENHNKIGGLYSAVCEAVAGLAKVDCVAVEDRFGEVGPVDYLQKQFGLTAEHLMEVVKRNLD